MKNKIRVFIFIVLMLVLCLVYYSYKNKYFSNNLKKEDIVDDRNNNTEEETKDLFENYYDKALERMSLMTLEEKIGQLFLVRYDNNVVKEQITKYYPGGYILFAKDFENHDKNSILEELSNNQKLSKIPLIFGVDEEGGVVTRVSRFSQFRSERFKSPQELFLEGGYDLLAANEKEKAELLLSLGINFNLAPVADVSVDSNDFIYNRCFGKDANATAEYIKNMVSYAKNAGISSCLKHFPGYGNNSDTHTGSAYDKRSYDNFKNNDFLPFKSGIDAGVPTILVSHNIVESIDSTYPSSLSKKIISELRNTLGFTGVVITDDLAMGAVASYVEEGRAPVLAINAGNDMIITSDFEVMYQEVLDAVNNNVISKETIDRAVKRILAWKYSYNVC